MGWDIPGRFSWEILWLHPLKSLPDEEVEGVGVAVRQRPNLSPADRARGTLKLTNLTLEMSGVYVCRAENQAGSKNCSIVLEVHSSE